MERLLANGVSLQQGIRKVDEKTEEMNELKKENREMDVVDHLDDTISNTWKGIKSAGNAVKGAITGLAKGVGSFFGFC